MFICLDKIVLVVLSVSQCVFVYNFTFNFQTKLKNKNLSIINIKYICICIARKGNLLPNILLFALNILLQYDPQSFSKHTNHIKDQGPWAIAAEAVY